MHYLSTDACEGQEKVEKDLELRYRCLMWVLGPNQGPQQEQKVLLTTVLPLQSRV